MRACTRINVRVIYKLPRKWPQIKVLSSKGLYEVKISLSEAKIVYLFI